MTENNAQGATGTGAGSAADGNSTSVHVQMAGQYVKDLSFENPVPERLLAGLGEAPNLKLGVNVGAAKKGENLYESAIEFKAHASNTAGTIYDLEVIYAGLFRIRDMPDSALEPFLLINAPMLLFPFLRRLVADLSREGGFPPLMLDPIDFAGLYMKRKQEEAAARARGAPVT